MRYLDFSKTNFEKVFAVVPLVSCFLVLMETFMKWCRAYFGVAVGPHAAECFVFKWKAHSGSNGAWWGQGEGRE